MQVGQGLPGQHLHRLPHAHNVDAGREQPNSQVINRHIAGRNRQRLPMPQHAPRRRRKQRHQRPRLPCTGGALRDSMERCIVKIMLLALAFGWGQRVPRHPTSAFQPLWACKWRHVSYWCRKPRHACHRTSVRPSAVSTAATWLALRPLPARSQEHACALASLPALPLAHSGACAAPHDMRLRAAPDTPRCPTAPGCRTL